jgi:hypothetical protein
MEIGSVTGRWRGRGKRNDEGWGDERQQAVRGQASIRALYAVIVLDLVASLTFNTIDYKRYEPCVTVFFLISLGSTAYAMWTARRRGGVSLKVRRLHPVRLVASSLVFGVIYDLLNTYTGGGPHHASWLRAVLTVGIAGTVWGIALDRWAARRQRQAQLEREAPDDDVLNAPNPLL